MKDELKASSILGRARTEAYNRGFAQASQLSHDEAHELGRIQGWREGSRVGAWNRLAWFTFGVVIGTGFTWGIT